MKKLPGSDKIKQYEEAAMHLQHHRRKKLILRILTVLAALAVVSGGIFLFLRVIRGAPQQVLPGIYRRGTILIGVTSDTPPLGSLDENGSLTGFEADLARAIGSRIVTEKAVVLVPVTNRTRAAKLDYEYIDFAVAMISNAKANQERYQQSDPYYQDPVGFLCRPGEVSSVESLAGKNIGVFLGSLSKSQLQSKTAKLDSKPQLIDYTSFEELEAALTAGEIDLVCAEESLLKQMDVPGFSLADYTIGTVDYAVTIRKNENDLYQLVGQILKDMGKDGTLDALYEKYGLTPPAQ